MEVFKVKIGMFTSGYQRNPIEHIFMDAKRFGYDYIELWGGRPHGYPFDLKNGGIKEIKKLIEQYETPVLCYTPEMNAYPFNMMIGTEAMRKEAVDYVKLSMDMAKEMGADFTTISAGHGGYYASREELWDRLLKSIREITDYAENIGHKVVLEPLTHFETNVVKSAHDLVEVFKQVPSPNLLGMCDVVPPFVQGESIITYFDKLKDKMYHMHIVDSDGTSDTHYMIGEGKLPLKELMEELKEISYKGSVTIELVTAYINEPRLYAKRAINNLREIIVE